MRTIETTDGRPVDVDVDAVTAHQADLLAAGAADLLRRSGMIAADAVLSGPQIVQFLAELGEHLETRREERLRTALDAVWHAVDATDADVDAGITRESLLDRARSLRDEVDPPADREARRA